MTKVSYKKEHLIWDSWFLRVRVYDHHHKEHGRRPAGMVLEQELRDHISAKQHEAESELVMAWDFEASKSTPSHGS